MRATAANPLITPKELLRLSDGKHWELVDGQLTPRNTSAHSSWVAGRLLCRMNEYADTQKLGWVFPSTVGYCCFSSHPNTVRRPDLSFVRRGRLPHEIIPKGDITLAPDLAVEVVSPNDLYSEVEKRVEEYLQAGARQVWVIDPDNRKAWVHRADGSVNDVRAGGELVGEDLLPGLRCPLTDLLPPSETPPASGPSPESSNQAV